MGQTALTFSELLNRLRLVGVTVVESPLAPRGSVLLFGLKGGPIPYPIGPMYPLRARPSTDLIPLKMVQKILDRLELSGVLQAQFWAIQDHTEQRQDDQSRKFS